MHLNFKTFGEGFPLIILHGLLGSLDNWQSIAKKLTLVPYKVYIIDQRNHGKSPHSDEFSYEILANDLFEFYQQQNISKAHIIGHSLGGKVAMKFALQHPDKVEKLVVVDIAASKYPDEDNAIFSALSAADVHHAISREEVEKVLRSKLGNDETTIQFLLKGLNRDEAGKHFEWKFNLESLWKNYPNVGASIESAKPFEGPVLFIKGQKSNYINPANYQQIMELFPNNVLTEIEGASHWVHADKPNEFLEAVTKFLRED